MGISFYFLGICTHVSWEDETLAFPPRVVLTNGTAGSAVHREIRPHVPTLRIAAQDILNMDALIWPGTSGVIFEWQLNGARMRLENGTTVYQRHSSFDTCMPSLLTLTPDVGPPSKAAVEDGDPQRALCIFDVTHGTLSAGTLREHGAVFGMLRTETDGPPRLSIGSFGSALRKEIFLRDGAEVTIANLGATEHDDDSNDFFLHYELAAVNPTKPGAPHDPGPSCVVNRKPRPTWPPGFTSVDVGCSNSAYP